MKEEESEKNYLFKKLERKEKVRKIIAGANVTGADE